MIQLSASLEAFIADVEALVAAETDPSLIAQGVRRHLDRLLADPSFLRPEQREPDPERYRVHLLAVAPSRKFSVTALIWLPGQVTPIHDHICWCVVGVLQGLEHEERFHLLEGADGERWLTPAGVDILTAGHTCALIPPQENIHRVRNAGNDLAISIHVYGDDLDIYGSSINQCFDAVPIREDDTAGVPVAWRRVRLL
jgi:3-mercaptopropionate dioxygenase